MDLVVTLRVRRTTGWADFTVTVPSAAYLLDALEAAWLQDTSLLFRHACHHASCGSCGVRANGRECLACVTPIQNLLKDGPIVTVEPLRNFPIVGDLVIDYGRLYRPMEALDTPVIRQVDPDLHLPSQDDRLEYTRFENCIECGLCVSACPAAATDSDYLGPAALAAAWRIVQEPRGRDAGTALAAVDQQHGLWRCHSAFECSEVCPSDVDPAGAIMSLRRRLLLNSLSRR